MSHATTANQESVKPRSTEQGHRENNKLRPEDRAVHDWYRFILSFPPHLVREYLERFNVSSTQRILDPFCGTGTTLVECLKQGISCVGLEANPMAHFASLVKTDWGIDSAGLRKNAKEVAEQTIGELEAQGLADHPELPLFERPRIQNGALLTLSLEKMALLLSNSISPVPLHKALLLLRNLDSNGGSRYRAHERLALAKTLVFSASNLNFGPEVGLGAIKEDAAVVPGWLEGVEAMADDLQRLQTVPRANVEVHCVDARRPLQVLAPKSIDAVITSPPYPNEKDYTRTTRLESVVLGFLRGKEDLRRLKQRLVRSNTRGVYKLDEDDRVVAENEKIQAIASEIETRRIRMGKTSGFERLYAKVTRLYFGGMARHLSELREVLKPGAHLAYVVGDQASYLRVMIRTGQLLAEIATSLGYEVLAIDLFRTRLATATREQLREEVVVFRWPGERREGV